MSNESSFGFGVLHQNHREFNNGLSPNIGPMPEREDGDIGRSRYRTGGGLHANYLAWRYGHSGNFVITANTGAFVVLGLDSKTSQISYLLTLGRPW